MKPELKKILIKLSIILISTFIFIVFFAPLIFMIGASLRLDQHIFANIRPISIRTFVPRLEELTLFNFYGIFRIMDFGRPLFNSVVVGIFMTGGVLFINSLAAFAFSRVDLPYKNILFLLLLLPMFIPVQVSMIPMYNVVRALGFTNTYSSLIIPWWGQPFALFFFKQFFDGIPRSLDEAATIDGASLFGIFRHIIVPNAKPAFITLGLIQFLESWDGFFWPLIAVEDRALHVVQVAVATMLDPEYIRWGFTFASATLATVPILLVFLLLQRYYISGLTRSGIKG